ncbi:MAG: hypothetical protein F4125_11395 [Acidimicrobiaceae bacterium]|nr:hypothetical protein [Acidimicrobiaceae bacterium]
MVGTTYNVPPVPPDEASTDWFDFAPLRVGIEYRKVDPAALAEAYGDNAEHMAEIDEHSPEGGFSDEGISVHVVADGHEYLRFDAFVDDPHSHYIDKEAGTNTIVEFDQVAHGPVKPWVLTQLRSRLPEMLSHAGAAAVAESLALELGEQISQQVEKHLQAIGEM